MATRRSGMSASAQFYVPQVPTLPDAAARFQLYAGDLPARAGDGAALYFQLHRARHTAGRRRLIIWFNGGPGCSSFDGIMMEIGAWRTKLDGTLAWAPEGGSWNEYADVLYLDQPVGTGFSYAPTNAYVRSLSQAADEVKYFLERFVDIFPEYRKGNGIDTWLAGESFAGQYIPYTAKVLTERGPTTSPVELKGVAIGNGFIDPKSQYGSEIDFLVKQGVWKANGPQHKEALDRFQSCKSAMEQTKGNPRSIGVCESLLGKLISPSKKSIDDAAQCINIYDVRLTDTYPSCGMNWPPNIQATYDYLHRQDVRAAFHVDAHYKPEAWTECNPRVSRALSASDDEPEEQASVTLLPELLDRGVEVLINAGDQDLICNHVGLERMLDSLTWKGQTGFSQPAATGGQTWYVNEQPTGKWLSERGLTYVKVYNASHMVPFDLPVASNDMMLRFMNASLFDAAGPSARVPSRIGTGPDQALVWTLSAAALSDDKTQQAIDDAKYDAYYRSGSVALMVVISLVLVGVCALLRQRRKRVGHKAARWLAGRERSQPPRDGTGTGTGTDTDMELDRLVEHAEEFDAAPEEEAGAGDGARARASEA